MYFYLAALGMSWSNLRRCYSDTDEEMSRTSPRSLFSVILLRIFSPDRLIWVLLLPDQDPEERMFRVASIR